MSFHHNYGWTLDYHHQNQQPAVLALLEFRADSSSLMLKFAERAVSVVNVLFNPCIDVFIARAWFLFKGALETHSSRKAVLLAGLVLVETIFVASVPYFFSKFQALRLEFVKIVFSIMSSHLNFICLLIFSRRRTADSLSWSELNLS
jgi:hypothetical protein